MQLEVFYLGKLTLRDGKPIPIGAMYEGCTQNPTFGPFPLFKRGLSVSGIRLKRFQICLFRKLIGCIFASVSNQCPQGPPIQGILPPHHEGPKAYKTKYVNEGYSMCGGYLLQPAEIFRSTRS